MPNLTPGAAEIIEAFEGLERRSRLDLLLEFSEALPDIPSRLSEHPNLFERVEECQSPVFLIVEQDTDGSFRLHFTAPREAPTTRGFASILHNALDGCSSAEILDFDEDFPSKLGLSEAISPLRMRGIRGMLARIKRRVREKLAS